jgi:hypothetical protein
LCRASLGVLEGYKVLELYAVRGRANGDPDETNGAILADIYSWFTGGLILQI